MVVRMGGNSINMLKAETAERESVRRLRDEHEHLRALEDDALRGLLRCAALMSGYVDAREARASAVERIRSLMGDGARRLGRRARRARAGDRRRGAARARRDAAPVAS